jgi:hypothetical protein
MIKLVTFCPLQLKNVKLNKLSFSSLEICKKGPLSIKPVFDDFASKTGFTLRGPFSSQIYFAFFTSSHFMGNF